MFDAWQVSGKGWVPREVRAFSFNFKLYQAAMSLEVSNSAIELFRGVDPYRN